MNMRLSKVQIDAVAKYLADISKLVFGASVLGFFVPIGPEPVTAGLFVGGCTVTVVALFISIKLTR